MKEEGLDFLTLVDRKGTVIFRVHSPRLSGDSLIHGPFVKKGLEKEEISGTQVLSGEELLKQGEAHPPLLSFLYVRDVDRLNRFLSSFLEDD